DVAARLCFSFHSHRPDVFRRVMPSLDFDTVAQNLADAVELARAHDSDVVAALGVLDCNLDSPDDDDRFVTEPAVPALPLQRLQPGSSVIPIEGVEGGGGRRPAGSAAAPLRRALDAAIELGVFVETNCPEIAGDPRNVQRRRTRFDVLNETSALVDLYCPRF